MTIGAYARSEDAEDSFRVCADRVGHLFRW